MVEARAPCSLSRQAGLPLLVRHLEQVDLRYGTGDVA